MSTRSRKRIVESFAITLVLMAVFLGTGALAQYRQVDQGKGGTTSGQVWLVKICDAAGANCGVVAIPVTITGTIPVTGTVQSNAGTGTVNVTCISGCGGASAFLDTAAFAYGVTPIGNMGAVVDTAATHTVGDGLAGAPRMSTARILLVSPQGTTTISGAVSATSGTIGQMPSLSVTSGTIGSITMPSLTVTSSTVGQITMPSLTFTSGTVGQITMPSLTVTSGTVSANQGTAANATAGWPVIAGVVTATTTALTSASPLDTTIGVGTKGYASALVSVNISGSITLGTYIFEGSDDSGATYKYAVPCARADVSPAGPVTTLSVNSPTQWLVCPVRGLNNFRARLNPAITNTGTGNITVQASNQAYDPFVFASVTLNAGGNTVGAVKEMVISATDTTASTAAGSDVRARADKFGDLITAFSIPDHVKSRSDVLTATTASSVLAAPGANYRYAIYGMYACNLSGIIATQLDITDSSGTIYSLPWTQTATTGGEDRCIAVPMGVPYFTAANSTISEKLSVANATGVRIILSVAQTGT